MRTLFELSKNGYDLITCGTNSIILKKDGYAYKITREFSADNIDDIKSALEKLADSGINVLKIEGVEEIKFQSHTDFNLVLAEFMDAKHTNQELKAPHNQSLEQMSIADCFVVPMLKFDYVDGVNLFGDKRLDGLNFINKNTMLKNASTLHPVVLEKLNKDLLFNLQIAEQITAQEAYKFMADCKKIIKAGFSVDNRTGDNFIYGTNSKGEKGIFFIDLGGIEKMSKGVNIGETNLFFATIDNLCKMIYVETSADLGQTRERIEKVCEKYDSVLKKFVSDNPDCQKQFEEYMKSDNYYSKLQKTYGNRQSEYQPE